MPLSRQPQQIDLYDTGPFPPEMDPQAPDFARWNARYPVRIGYQVEQSFAFIENPCAQEWEDIFTMDIRFVGTLGVDHLRQRALVVMQSASGEPDCPVPGAEVHTLYSADRSTPANFGGDGHGWWKVCYVVPDSGDEVDFSGVTGSMRYATWFTCAGDLPTGSGNFGDGVALIFSDDQDYVATFGSVHASVDVSQVALPKDAIFFWNYPNYRDFDDMAFTKTFHNEDNSFDHDKVKHNELFIPLQPGGGIDSSIDWTTDDRSANAPATVYTMKFDIDATTEIFPGALRVLATAFGCDLRALCP